MEVDTVGAAGLGKQLAGGMNVNKKWWRCSLKLYSS